MRASFVALLLISANCAQAAEPTPEQADNRRRFLNVALASGCDKKFGEPELLNDAIAALRKGVARISPGDASDVEKRFQDGLNENAELAESFTMLATKDACTRVRNEVAKDLKD